MVAPALQSMGYNNLMYDSYTIDLRIGCYFITNRENHDKKKHISSILYLH